MQIGTHSHLTYCTNIHPGESWPEVWQSLKDYTLPLKNSLSPRAPFGIGLRLSNKSSIELAQAENCSNFQKWLSDNGFYVFTMNGFPYGTFHHQAVKDKVHQPDWTTKDRLNYTKRLFKLLAVLLPEGMDGGISTSPLSYKFWFKNEQELNKAKSLACDHLIEIAAQLVEIKKSTGKSLHLDIEPEPDGILEDSAGFIDYYNEWLLKKGSPKLAAQLGCTIDQAGEHIREHIQLCYDVCHFAVGFEEPGDVVQLMKKQGIRIGKIQISAALKVSLGLDVNTRKEVSNQLTPFNESTYLHQVTLKTKEGQLAYFPDLADGLAVLENPDFQELRTHFHVPIFTEQYGILNSTQDDIKKTLAIWKSNAFTNHLEVETYTWEVLPKHLKLRLKESIERELQWVLNELEV